MIGSTKVIREGPWLHALPVDGEHECWIRAEGIVLVIQVGDDARILHRDLPNAPSGVQWHDLKDCSAREVMEAIADTGRMVAPPEGTARR